MNKRGSDLVSVMMWVGLGILVFVVLAVSFSIGWSELWSKFNIIGGKGSLSSFASACEIKCGAQDATGWCESFADPIKGLTKEQVSTNLGIAIQSTWPATNLITASKIGKQVTLKKSGDKFELSGVNCDDLLISGLIKLANTCSLANSCVRGTVGTTTATKKLDVECTNNRGFICVNEKVCTDKSGTVAKNNGVVIQFVGGVCCDKQC